MVRGSEKGGVFFREATKKGVFLVASPYPHPLEPTGHILKKIELQKRKFFLIPHPLLVAGPLRKENFFCGFLYQHGFVIRWFNGK